MKPVSFAFVWKEEQEILAQIAASIPENGVIVEIGTAMGGTAMIFHQALCNKGIKIYTVDALDCSRAKDNLKNTDVTIINLPSHEFAKIWRTDIRTPIDFLYIDGDHNFISIFEDFNVWFPLLANKGIVAFHDYDPIKRGGLAHLGVKICLDTISEKGFLGSVRHNYKIFSGVKENNDTISLDWRDCFRTFLGLAESINSKRQEIFKDSVEAGLEMLQARSLQFDSVEACYCIEHALTQNFEYLDTHSHSFYDFRRWVEMLTVLDHAHGQSQFPVHFENISMPKNSYMLSKMIAHEQVRISILALILKTFITWEP
jgi:hypothetical protein